MLKRSILVVAFLFAMATAGLTGYALRHGTEGRMFQGEVQIYDGRDQPGSNPSEDVTPAPDYAPRAAGSPAAGLNPSVEVTPAAPRVPTAVSFVRFTDPTEGAFILDVPRGWQVNGGLNHAGLGDFRWFVQALSPDGIIVMWGDPNCPQSFCHFPAATEDMMIPTPQGCTFLNIPPEAMRLASYYLKNVAPQRFGPLKITRQRDRDDIAAEEITRARQLGIAVPNSFRESILETRFEADRRIGCFLAASGYDPATSPGFMTSWQGNVYVCLAPPALTAVAEQVLTRMRTTFRNTPRMMEVWKQDEMLIASNGTAANLIQKDWFRRQQDIYREQVAQGEAYINGDRQRQPVNDRLSKDRSDTMLGTVTLVEEGSSRTYSAPAGYNYYWRNQQTDEIVPTNTSGPPDYQRNYTELRKP